MLHSTAGDAYGELPTYCTKWSSIWHTRASGTRLRICPATDVPIRSDSTSRNVSRFMPFIDSVSVMLSTDFQKKNFSETLCRPLDMAMKSWKPCSLPGA